MPSLHRNPISLTDPRTLSSHQPPQNVHCKDVSGRRTVETHESRTMYPRRGAVDLTAASPTEPQLRALYSRRPTVAAPATPRRPRALHSRRDDRTATNSEPSWDSPPHFVVGRNDDHFPRISFFPHDGLGAGVAMGLAFYQEGMVMKQSSIEFCLPAVLRHTEYLPFTLRWPGYAHINVKQNITLIDPETGYHVTYGRIAQQVSQVFSTFIHHFGDDFDHSAGGIQLGPKAVTFHNLRLHQVYIRDGRSLEVEVSYSKRN